jgi:hypothetical protein
LDRHGRQLPQTVADAEADQYPTLHGAFCVEVLQGPGEGLFVPSGWHHQVRLLASRAMDSGLVGTLPWQSR